MQAIRGKKSFTLIELIIVVLIIFTTYFLMFSNNSFNINQEKQKITISNLKEFLSNNFEFEKELSFVCIEDKYSCYIKIDGVVLKESKIENFFTQTPEVYEYSKDELKMQFSEVNIDDINHDVIFEFKINSDFKSNEFIVDTLENGVYVFNSLFKEPFFYEDAQMAFEQFYLNEIEVRDAF